MKCVVAGLAAACGLVCLGDASVEGTMARAPSLRNAVERVPVPKAGVNAVSECGDAIGPAKVWDFTKGALPPGCKLRKNGTVSDKGIGSHDFADNSSPRDTMFISIGEHEWPMPAPALDSARGN